MRWFIEVSRVGELAPAEKYCLEAKQWQAALQEARKLRGDSGPLSKFSIELLDEGYRAVDPTLKIRYVVAKAPSDAPISLPGNNSGGRHASEPAPRTEPMASPEPLSPAAPEPAPKTDPMGLPPLSAPVPDTTVAPTARPKLVVPEDVVPPAPPPPAESRKVIEATKSVPPAVTHPTQRSLEAAKPPDFQLIRKREEEPNAQSPIAYREYAYAVKPGTPPQAAELLLWFRFKEIQGSLEERPAGKFVQLAVFDHVFERKPVRPPIATLAWKDWRGEPVLHFPDPNAKLSSAPPPAPSVPPASFPAPAATPGAPSAPPVAAPAPAAPSAPPVAAPAPVTASAPAPAPAAPSAPPVAAPAPVAASPSPSAPVPAPAPASAPPSAAPAPVAASTPPGLGLAIDIDMVPATVGKGPASEPTPSQAPVSTKPKSSKRTKAAKVAPAPAPVPSDLPPPRRRKQGEDLISELFETMHDLHFVTDIVSGATFVLGVLQQLLPSEGAIVHVFDINTRHFVAVRAAGPAVTKVLLHRTHDTEPLFVEAMRRTRALRFADVTADERFVSERWERLGVKPKSVLCGPVQQAGRYLGLIELANPQGGDPYHEGESNALDYICEQFAEFIAARPIVVDADVVLGRV